jgi:hypothetical protein
MKPRRVAPSAFLVPALTAFLACGCGAAKPPAAPDPTTSVPSVAAAATSAIDPGRCIPGKRERPFVVGWDVTDVAELSAASQHGLVGVRLEECSVHLVPECRIPGSYEDAEVPGGQQTLRIDSENQLRAELPLSVAALSGELSRSSGLDLAYFVSSMRSASQLEIGRSTLPEGCRTATHFVVNIALGAFELATRNQSSASADVRAFGAGAGGKSASGASTAFNGGKLASCPSDPRDCRAPVRLRLLPFTDGPVDPSASDAVPSAKVVPTTDPPPAAAQGAPKERAMGDLQAAVARTTARMTRCYNGYLGASPTDGVQRALGKVIVEADGSVSAASVDVVPAPSGADLAPATAFRSCLAIALHGANFGPAQQVATVNIPLVFKKR